MNLTASTSVRPSASNYMWTNHHRKEIPLQGEVKIDSPFIGQVQASNGLAYLLVGGGLLIAALFVYLKFRAPIHARASRVRHVLRRRK